RILAHVPFGMGRRGLGVDQALLGVIERLYSAATAPGEWVAALEQARDLFGAGHAILSVADPGLAWLHVLTRVDEHELARSLAAAAGPVGLEGTGLRAATPAGIATTRSSLISDEAFARSAYYNEVVRPLNGFHSLSVRQAGGSAGFAMVFCRSPRR